MTDIYSKARFWKCALQVNPSEYIKYRGQEHGLSEEEYNRELLRVCQEQGIKVIGLADHGNVDGIDSIRDIFTDSGVIVFPGFEITSTEKAHFVCLFPESTSKNQLNRYLGSLQLLDPTDDVWPSKLGGEDLVAKVNENGGFVYAAHCTQENGVLARQLHHVWGSENLHAAQIPHTLEELRLGDTNPYYRIIRNLIPEYQRDNPIAYINAKDVAQPEDLVHPNSICYVKMTQPCFESFKSAFLDPRSRIRLSSDFSENPHSRIEELTITEGYLQGLQIEFSEHLNTIIGGRGTGKSTLIECIRFALNIPIHGEKTEQKHEKIIEDNLKTGTIEIKVRSYTKNNKIFSISRSKGGLPVVKDENGDISSFTIEDIFPSVEIFGQNEIYEITNNNSDQLQLLNRFEEINTTAFDTDIIQISHLLEENRKTLLGLLDETADDQEEVSKLPKLHEELKHFSSYNLDEKLQNIQKIEKEGTLCQKTIDKISSFSNDISEIKEKVPDSIFLNDENRRNVLHQKKFQELYQKFSELESYLNNLFLQVESQLEEKKSEIEKILLEINSSIAIENSNIQLKIDAIPELEGHDGNEIAEKYRSIIANIERIKPFQENLENKKKLIHQASKVRSELLQKLVSKKEERFQSLQKGIKKINRKLDRRVRISLTQENNRQPLVIFLINCHIERVNESRLNWIYEAEGLNPIILAQKIRSGQEALIKAEWRITSHVQEGLLNLPESKKMELEEITLPDEISIELNVSHNGSDDFRPLEKLSTGQQCTAILHLLLLENWDPLIIDQPEDNLDNAFIADRIVEELRSAKNSRQFIFATHNANIPVFGDAEWIGVFEGDSEHGFIPDNLQGSIDLPDIQKKAADILEGGKNAFILRKKKYGY